MECLLQWLSFINQYFSTTVLAISVIVAIFLGMKQLKEVRKGQASIAYQSIIDTSYELEKLYVEYPSVYLGMQNKKDIDEFAEEERTRLDWITFMTLDFFDNLLYQKNRGVIEPGSEVWFTWERSMKSEFRRCPYLGELLRNTLGLYTGELVRLSKTSQS